MNKIKVLYWLSFVVLSLFIFSCKIQEKDNVKIKIKTRSPKFLVKKLKENEFKFNTISAKAAIILRDSSDKKTSFKIHLRIKKDSAIWMSITPLLGIEAARVIITNDTVKFLNRVKKEYFVGDFEYINRVFGTDIDYQMLEALLIGNSLSFDEKGRVNSRLDRKKGLYYLSTIKKRKVKKEIKKEKEKIKKEAQVLWLDPMRFKIKELLLSSPESHRSLSGSYSDYRDIDMQLIPFNIQFLLKSNTSSKIEIKYSKFSTGKALSFPFKISTKYVQIKN